MFGLFGGKARRFQFMDAEGFWHVCTSGSYPSLWVHDGKGATVSVSCGALSNPLRRRKTSKPPTCPECLEGYGKIL